jgi:hypothetical protein
VHKVRWGVSRQAVLAGVLTLAGVVVSARGVSLLAPAIVNR